MPSGCGILTKSFELLCAQDVISRACGRSIDRGQGPLQRLETCNLALDLGNPVGRARLFVTGQRTRVDRLALPESRQRSIEKTVPPKNEAQVVEQHVVARRRGCGAVEFVQEMFPGGIC